jgi:hypothetical protein
VPDGGVLTGDGRSGKALFVVRSATPGSTAGLLYKVSTNTYHAYNHTGGGSLYRDQIWNQNPDGTLAAYPYGVKVSLRRPGGGTGGDLTFTPDVDTFGPNAPRQGYTHWDPPLIGWLEALGWPVEYCADIDLHEDPNLLAPYALLLSVGHDEYWSQDMRTHVARFIQGGGNVAFLSGNICWWRVHYTDGNTAIVCDRGYATDNWWKAPPTQDSPNPAPENTLTGVSYRNAGEYDADGRAPTGFQVQHADHWVFEGTGLRNGDVFGADARLVGYECDGAFIDATVVDEQGLYKPTGVDGTPLDFVILGVSMLDGLAGWKLSDPPDREATGLHAATMGVYTHQGTVFTAATTDWPCALVRSDANVARITLNVMNRLGGNPKGLATLAQLDSVLTCDGFFSPDDNYRHAIVGTRGGEITEIFFNPQTGQGQALLTTRNGLLDLGAFYSDDDRYRHVIAATSDGNVWEVFYNPNTGLGQTVLRNIPNVTRVCGFFSPDDNYRHAIAATSDGQVYEIFFNPQTGLGTALLGTFQNIVDIGGFYTPDDRYRHVLVGTADGTVTEIYYSPSRGTFQAVIATVPDLTRVSAYYAADDRFFNRRVQVLTSSGRIHEIRYHPDFGIMRAVLFNLGSVLDLGGFFSPDDNYRHAILASQTGTIQELFFRP